ncbi:prolyl oligopeptidase family serine peptidase [Phreatobacter sp.]|uniref:alpha/beta hydrolase family protein n=1 Tax=Phreatobacter sp. TaxID=1966341 RepID=UPI0022CCF1C7|nr:prolyl oligopeptidase family serine peptidase [Phreatobacter sp.]MCZ8316739.1 prolyl oligopeptidase family serine peptidase [Phreatobacter sp.]
MRRRLCLVLAALLAVAPAAAQEARPEGQEGSRLREQVWRIPHVSDEGRVLAAILFRPPGETPRPLVVMAHHTSAEAARNGEPAHGVYPQVVAWFVERGYAVAIVHRRGYGLTGGERAERFACRRPNHAGVARADAADLAAVIDALTRLPFIRPSGVVAVGQSTGGWAVMGLAAENHPAVAAVINFGGGRRGRSGETGDTCALEELVRDIVPLGRRARTPALWIYTENDQTFGPALARRLADAYRAAGAPLEFRMLPAFGSDGHALLPSTAGVRVWAPVVEPFILQFR